MGYHRDLDEYTDKELDEEIRRRAAYYESGICPYCGREGTLSSCKIETVHMNARGIRLKLYPDAKTFAKPKKKDDFSFSLDTTQNN